MQMMQIGKSSVYAPKLVLGSFGMGGGTSWQDTTENDQELIDFIKEAHEIGICGIDTAPVYGTGRSERIVGQAIREDRENWYLSTKCSMHWRSEAGTFQYERDGCKVYNCFDKDSIIRDVEDSLRRLGTDYIDMMIIHRTPAITQIPEVMEAMQALKDRGLIKSVGLSNAGLTDYAVEAVETCVRYGELDLVQEHASLLFRNHLSDYLGTCEKHQITFQDYSGLEKGALAGKLIEGVTGMTGDNRSRYKWFQPEGIEKLNALTKGLIPIAEKYGCTVPVLCLAWLKQQSPMINLLVGARRKESIEDTMKVLDVTINAEDLAAMTALADISNQE